MFRYVPTDKSALRYHSSTVDAPSIEELLKLCKAGEVERVIIPQTFDREGYGADLMSLSNSRSIVRDYGRRVKPYGHELSISSWQFVKHEEFRDMIERLEEEYPLYDEEDHSRLESETLEDFIVDELSYALRNEDDEDSSAEEWTTERVREVLHSGDWQTNIEWWEHCQIDNDGLTPYATDEDLKTLVGLLKSRAAAIAAETAAEEFRAAGNVELPGL